MDSLPSSEVLFEHAACGLLVTSPDGYIQKVNETFCTWIGFEKTQLLKLRRFQDLLTIGGKVFHQTHWIPLMEMQGSAAEVQLDIRANNGETFPVIVNAIRRKHGEATFHELSIFVSRDRKQYEKEILLARRTAEEALVEKEKIEQQLQQINEQLLLADRQKNVFIATMAHELRNPLMPISLSARLIKMKGQDAGIANISAVIERQVKQLSLLLDDLVDVSRISNGVIELKLSATTLKDVLQVAIDVAQPMFDEREQTFIIHDTIHEATLFCDAARVSQVIGNLLVNAAKYTNSQGVVELSTAMNGNNLIITVQDNGIGIPASKMDSIFEMFSQVEGLARRSGNGMGVGLALVKKLCELHNGSVSLKSDGEGTGSQFSVVLPIIS